VNGNFTNGATVRDFVGNNPVLREAEVELREQIKRALEAGLKIDYVDYHMGAAIATPELQELVYKLAREIRLEFQDASERFLMIISGVPQ